MPFFLLQILRNRAVYFDCPVIFLFAILRYNISVKGGKEMTVENRLKAIRLIGKLEKDKEMALLIKVELAEKETIKKSKKDEKSS